MHCEVCGTDVKPGAARRLRSDILCVECLDSIRLGIQEARRRAYERAASRPRSSDNGGKGPRSHSAGRSGLADEIRLAGRSLRLIGGMLLLLLLVEVVQLLRGL